MRVKAKTESKLISRLQRLWKETRDEPRIPARRSQQGYTHSPFQGMDRGDEGGAELEAVDELTQRRFTKEAREREFEDVAGVVVAAEAVLDAIKARSEEIPSLRRTYWPVRRELDRFIEREKRKAA